MLIPIFYVKSSNNAEIIILQKFLRPMGTYHQNIILVIIAVSNHLLHTTTQT